MPYVNKSLLNRHNIDSLILASMSKKSIEYKAFGPLLDNSHERLVSCNSIFQIASISKLLTSCIVLRLHKQCLIDLYCPYQVCSESDPRCFTLSELLQHRSGIVNDMGYSGFSANDSIRQLPDPLEIELNKHYHSECCSTYHYCGINYRAIQRILENQLNVSFEDLLCEMICIPLQMYNTTSSVSKLDQALTIHGFNQYGKVLDGGWNLFTGCEAAAGIWSSASDLCKLVKALLKSSIDSERDFFDITWRDLVNTKLSGNYRYGCFVESTISSLRIGHSGRNPGYQSMLWFNPRNHTGEVTLGNDDKSPLRIFRES